MFLLDFHCFKFILLANLKRKFYNQLNITIYLKELIIFNRKEYKYFPRINEYNEKIKI